MIRFLSLLMFFAFGLVGHAQASFPATNGTEYSVGTQGNFGQGWWPSIPQATAGYCSARGKTGCFWNMSGACSTDGTNQTNPPLNAYLMVPSPCSSFGNTLGWTSRQGTFCPANATLSGSTCTCQAGYTEVNGQCLMNPCPGGVKQDKNINVGWARPTARSDGAPWSTVDGRNYYAPAKKGAPLPGDVPLPETICDGQCTWVADGAPSDFWVAENPASTGMHAIYRQQGYMRTGAVCSASSKTPAADPATPPPPCDGYMGTVNGVQKCIAKEPPTGATGAAAPSGPKTTSTGAGSAPTDVPSKQYGPNGESPGKAGDVPSVQDLGGTGTTANGGPTPTQSTSTTTGKTTTNADGSTTTTSTTTFDIQVCGLPGKPACKIDESGTPGKVDLSASDQKLGKGFDDLGTNLSAILNKGDKDTSFSMPTWFTSQACSPFDLGTLPVGGGIAMTVNACPALDPALGVINFLWVVGMFFIIVAMVGRVMGPGKGD